MEILIGILIAVAVLALICLITAFICFLKVFYSPQWKRRKSKTEIHLPPGKAYEPFYEQMTDWQIKANRMNPRNVEIKSFDGLTLRGRYFEYSPDAPIELILHGYRGNSRRDVTGGLFRCIELGHSALLVDHRGAGDSGGNVTSFGALERHDCLGWINFIVENINKDAVIYIGGVSMGAATVMLVSEMDVPRNVKCVLADCGYTSAEDIIKKVMRDMKLPPKLLFPFVRLGGKLFGRFDIMDASPIKAMKNAKLPIIFFHGRDDDFVPCEMSQRNFDECVAKKEFVVIDGARHGLCFPVDRKRYVDELRKFYSSIAH